jgi:signal peptidase
MKFFIKLVSFVYVLFMFFSVLTLFLIYAPRLAKITPLPVETKSLEEKYPVGSLMYVQKTDMENFSVDDAVTFLDAEGNVDINYIVSKNDVSGVLVTRSTSGTLLLTNSVSYDNVLGKPIAMLPYAGNIWGFAATVKLNLPVLIEVVVLMIILSFVVGRIKKAAWDNV